MTTIERSRRGDGQWIVFNRPQLHNAINAAMAEELLAALQSAASDDRIRAVVLTGAGASFCSGADLGDIAQEGDSGERRIDPDRLTAELLNPLRSCLQLIRDMPKPVIAAVNGACCAGGLEITLCCDLVLAAVSARFSDGHARHGLTPGLGGAAALARSLGPFRAKELLFTSDWWSASQFAEAGVVGRVVEDPDLDEAAADFVEALSAHSADSLTLMKTMVNRPADGSWTDSVDQELGILLSLLRSSGFKLGSG